MADYGTVGNYDFSSAFNEQRVTAQTPSGGNLFGYSVAISGIYAIVGEYSDDTSFTDSGAVIFFELIGGVWTRGTKFKASNVGSTDRYGWSVAISGDSAAVGAPQEDGAANATGNSGAVYTFQRNTSNVWVQSATILRATNIGANDLFGYSVAMSGSTLIVGAYSEDGESTASTTSNFGAVYFFERNGSNAWIQAPILRADNYATDDQFGWSVAISGNYAIVGAPQEDGTSNNITDCGAAYIFERPTSTGSWSQVKVLRATDLETTDKFGYSVAISGNYAIVGAVQEDGTTTTGNLGAAYIFERDAVTGWGQTAKLTANKQFTSAQFGTSVAISGDVAIVGVLNQNIYNTSVPASGATFIFQRNNSGNWNQVKILQPSNVTSTSGAGGFGNAVAVSGANILVGASAATTGSVTIVGGAAYFYLPGLSTNPTPLTFNGNTLTITNSITATDVDPVSFSLTSGDKLYPFMVNTFTGTGTITYSLGISGGANVVSGTFTTTGVNLLNGNVLTAAGDTTYILNLTANAAITYTIVGSLLTAPTNILLSTNSINELKSIGTTIGTLTCDNPNNAFITYSVSDTANFSITGSTLKTNAIFDFESVTSYTVTITASIGGLTSSNTITISVTNILNEAAELRSQNLQGLALQTAVASQSNPPITATQLKEAGYNATELKEAGFTATDLKAAGFTGTELKAAGFTATHMKQANYTAAELNELGYAATQMSTAGYTVAELKAAGYTATQMKEAFYTATQLREVGYTATELKAALYNATEMKAALYTATQLRAVDFTAIELKDAQYYGDALKAAGYNSTEMIAANYNGYDFKILGYTATEMRAGGYTAAQLLQYNYSGAAAAQAGFTAAELKQVGYGALDLKSSFTATELKAAGYNVSQMFPTYTVAELRAVGYTPTQVFLVVSDTNLMLQGGYTIREMLTTGNDIYQLKSYGWTATHMRADGYTATESRYENYTAAELKAAGYNATEMKSAGYNVAELRAVGYTNFQLKEAGYTATEVKTAGYTATQLKADGYTATQLKADGYTATELSSAGYTLSQLVMAGYNATELTSAAFTASQIISAGLLPNWNIDASANYFIKSYVNDFVDVSGYIGLRNNANLYVHGNAQFGGNLSLNKPVLEADLSFNNRIFVGGDISMNGKVNIGGNVSLIGSVVNCSNVANNSVPQSAFNGIVSAGPNYTAAKVAYRQNFQVNADVSMNGTTVQANNVRANGNIVFSDGTIMNSYDNNILSTNPTVFKPSTFTSLIINGSLTAGSYSTSSDYRIKTEVAQLDETVTVDNLRPVKYVQTLINKTQYGLIAHELQEYYPDLVVGEKDGDGWQRVNYTGLIAILINEIKRMKQDLAELEGEI